MISNNIIKFVGENISKGESVSPFLYVGQKGDIPSQEIQTIAHSLALEFGVDKNYIYTLNDSEESLKVEEVRDFITPSFQKPPFAFQIFIIENISRLTLTSANTLLKFLEEPGSGNIIFLTNTSESGILDTILSRVQIISMQSQRQEIKEGKYITLIRDFVEKKNSLLATTFFTLQFTEEEALEFLRDILLYIQQSGKLSHLVSEVEDDYMGIQKNNLSPKYICDKYILQLHGQ